MNHVCYKSFNTGIRVSLKMLEGPSVTEIGVGQPNLAMTSTVNITSRYTCRLMILAAYNNFLDGDCQLF